MIFNEKGNNVAKNILDPLHRSKARIDQRNLESKYDWNPTCGHLRINGRTDSITLTLQKDGFMRKGLAYLRGKEETLSVGSVGRQNRARLTALGSLDSLNLRVTDDLKPVHVIKSCAGMFIVRQRYNMYSRRYNLLRFVTICMIRWNMCITLFVSIIFYVIKINYIQQIICIILV